MREVGQPPMSALVGWGSPAADRAEADVKSWKSLEMYQSSSPYLLRQGGRMLAVSDRAGDVERKVMMNRTQKVLCSAILGVLPLVGGCAGQQQVKETAELGK